ncbi:MAG TPA: hypothetical protein VIX89_11435, partial [Bryobacteraceae bacterium]
MGQVGNLRPIGNRPVNNIFRIPHQADCQSAAGYQPTPHWVFLLLLTILLALGPACARKESASVERLAILPFENLSSNNDLGWIGPAAAAAIVYDLTPSGNVYAQNVESIGMAPEMD